MSQFILENQKLGETTPENFTGIKMHLTVEKRMSMYCAQNYYAYWHAKKHPKLTNYRRYAFKIPYRWIQGGSKLFRKMITGDYTPQHFKSYANIEFWKNDKRVSRLAFYHYMITDPGILSIIPGLILISMHGLSEYDGVKVVSIANQRFVDVKDFFMPNDEEEIDISNFEERALIFYRNNDPEVLVYDLFQKRVFNKCIPIAKDNKFYVVTRRNKIYDVAKVNILALTSEHPNKDIEESSKPLALVSYNELYNHVKQQLKG